MQPLPPSRSVSVEPGNHRLSTMMVVREPITAQEATPAEVLALLETQMTALDTLLATGEEPDRPAIERNAQQINELTAKLWGSDTPAEDSDSQALVRFTGRLAVVVDKDPLLSTDLTDALAVAKTTAQAWQRMAEAGGNLPAMPARVGAPSANLSLQTAQQPRRQLGWNEEIEPSRLVFNLKALKLKPFATRTFFDFSEYAQEYPNMSRRDAWKMFKADHYPVFLQEVNECLQKIKEKLGDEMPHGGAEGLAAVYDEFRRGDNSLKYAANIETFCTEGKVAMDQIAQAIGDKTLPDELLKVHLKELVIRLAEQACGPGQYTDFIQAAQQLQTGLIPQLSAFREKIAEEIIQEHVNKVHMADRWDEARVYHVHWVNAYRNLFSQEFEIAQRDDPLAPTSLTQENIDQVHSALAKQMSPDKTIQLLAQDWHAKLKALVHGDDSENPSAQDLYCKNISMECFGGLSIYDVMQQVGTDDKYRLRGLAPFTATLTQKLMDAKAMPVDKPRVLVSLEDGNVCTLGTAVYFQPLTELTAMEELNAQHTEQFNGALQSPAFKASLLSAVNRGSTETIELLGNFINTRNTSSCEKKKLLQVRGDAGTLISPLHFALKDGDAEVIKMLGKVINNSGLTHADSKDLLLAKDAMGTPGLFFALQSKNPDVIKAFGEVLDSSGLRASDKKDLLMAKDTDGSPPLCSALRSGNAEAIRAFGDIIQVGARLPSDDAVPWLAEAANLLRVLRQPRAESPPEFFYTLSDDEKLQLLQPKNGDGASGIYLALRDGHAQAVQAYCELVERSGLLSSTEMIQLLVKKTQMAAPALGAALLGKHWDAFSEGLKLIERHAPSLEEMQAKRLHASLQEIQEHGAFFGNSAQYNQMKSEEPDLYHRFGNLKDSLKAQFE